jgi:alkylation response protein AidB-like acyl-CoA dehydrogenase
MIPLTNEQKQMRDMVRRLTRERIAPNAALIDAEEAFPVESYKVFAENGLLTLCVPEKYGGADADVTTLCLVIEEISKVSPASALMVFSTQAVYRVLRETGNDEQRDRFFSDIAAGDRLAAFVLTEPDFGSDAGSLRTKAVRDRDDYVLNGTKIFITTGSHASYYLVFARTGPGERAKGLSAFIVPRATPGLLVGKTENKMGLRGSMTNEIVFENARVPAANRLMEEGDGWKILTQVANKMRLWGAASMALGLAEGALECALNYARERRQFGQPIAQFQAIRFMLADMATTIESSRALIFSAAGMMDRGDGTPREIESLVSMCKCYATDAAMKIATDAVQVLGGCGYTKEFPAERMMRDAKALQILDGTNQIQRIVIARNLIDD